MHKIVTSVLCLLLAFAVRAQSELPLTTVDFVTKTYDFKTVREGTAVTYSFAFKNTGELPLKIETVKPGCGCLSAEWPQEEIAPGSEKFIKVSFDSKGKSGQQKKTVTVIFVNTDPKNVTLTVNAFIVK